jgi:hypothetical protein
MSNTLKSSDELIKEEKERKKKAKEAGEEEVQNFSG